MPQADSHSTTDSTRDWRECFESALADVRVSGAIVNGTALSLRKPGECSLELLADALDRAYTGAQHAVENLLKLNELQKAADCSHKRGERRS